MTRMRFMTGWLIFSFFGNGDGTFQPQLQFQTSAGGHSVTVGHFFGILPNWGTDAVPALQRLLARGLVTDE